MKKLLSIVFLSLMIFNPAKSGNYGEGELQLSDNIVEYFLQYLKGKGDKRPSKFYITEDGKGAQYWYCGSGSCADEGHIKQAKECSLTVGRKCIPFARKRTIKWKNGINPGKGKISQISSKLDLNGLKAKLTELGFYGNTTTTKKKETKKLIDIEFPEALKPFNQEKKEIWKKYMSYTNDTQWPYGAWFEIRTKNGYYNYGWAADKNLKLALKRAKNFCEKGKKKNKTIFTNSEICIVYSINGVETTNEEKIKYAEKFYKKKASESFEKNPWILKKTKITKKYSSEGERTSVVSWEGYSDMIVGTLNFSETDYEGTINLDLPNNEGTCQGSCSLQPDGKGTWQISCTNNMGAAGTLEWEEGVGVKGIGRDYNDKKVKFAASAKS